MLYEKIIEVFNETGSIKKTAADLKVSTVKVQKVLITEGLWASKSSREILALYNEGVPVKEIAERLHMSEKNVQAYIPYTRGTYDENEKSGAAVRSEQYRKRCSYDKSIQEKKHANKVGGATTAHCHVPALTKANEDKSVVRLRLEIVRDLSDERVEYLLREFGKMNRGLIRDVLVPGSITLHAMHYLIQRAFGLKNEHQHYFSLPDEVFQSCTHGRFSEWAEKCGVYFRLAKDEQPDIYWDDDYDGERSFRSWLRSKYIGPYEIRGNSESYDECQREVSKFIQAIPTVRVRTKDNSFSDQVIFTEDASIEDLNGIGINEMNANTLLERLTISDLMILDDGVYPASETDAINKAVPLTTELLYVYDFGSADWKVRITVIRDSKAAASSDAVADTETPVCVAQDGFEVIDNKMGIQGYCDFLESYFSENPFEREDCQKRAALIGWNDRKRRLSDVI